MMLRNSRFRDTVSAPFAVSVSWVRAERLIAPGNAVQQTLHMLPGFPRAGTTSGLNAVSPGLLGSGKVISISQGGAQHLIGGRIVRVETHNLAQRLRRLNPVFHFVLFTRQAVPDHGVLRLLGEHGGEDFDFRLGHRFVLSSRIVLSSGISNPLDCCSQIQPTTLPHADAYYV